MKSDSNIQFSDSNSIRNFQNERLIEEIKYLSENSPFYKRMFKDHSIDPNSIKSINDLQSIPVTTKEDQIGRASCRERVYVLV